MRGRKRRRVPIRAIFEAALGPQVEQAHERWITLPSLHIMLNGAVENISLESGGSIVTERTLRDFVGAGSVGAVAVIGAPEGGVGIAAFCGGQEKGHWRTLGTSRRAIRRFASIDTAAALLRNEVLEREDIERVMAGVAAPVMTKGHLTVAAATELTDVRQVS